MVADWDTISLMILWGEIREFPLFTVLQFLSQQRRTGILEIQDFEDLGFIYMSTGRVEGISMQTWDEMLGNRLVAAGALTESQVRECWLESGSSEKTPVIASLLDRAKGDHRELVDIVNRHTADAVMQLMYWNGGTFRFSTSAEPVYFPVIPSLSVDFLLLDAYRRVDEGERPWHNKISLEEELCLTCTIECSPEIKKRYLRPDVCLWRSMPAVLKDPIFRGMRKLGMVGERQERPGPGDEYGDMDDLPFV
ncbi:MAG: DUF4388 domain-containing protein [Actinobacteria bacterium]|nr:DUF4388 domain-containing protein [Actinomycetota bacterium]